MRRKWSLPVQLRRAGRRFNRSRQGRNSQRLGFELQEPRLVLNAAPVAEPDEYLIEQSPLEVGLPGDAPAVDESFQIPNLPASIRLVVDDGSHMQHPGFFTVGGPPNTYGEIIVTNPGSAITFNQFLELANAGHARMTISNGGRVHTTNWTEIAQTSGSAEATVTGPGSSWQNDNFMVVGDNNGRGRLTIADGATFRSNQHMTVGGDGGTGFLILDAGASATLGNWLEVGENSKGFIYVTGGASLAVENWMELAGSTASSYAKVVVSGEGSRFTGSGQMGWMDIGDGGHAEVRVFDGGLFTNRNATYLATQPGSLGQFTIGPGGRLDATSVYAGQGGQSVITVLDGGLAFVSFIENYAGGRIRGDGHIAASWINNQGAIEPGAHIGTLTLQSRLTGQSGSSIVFDVAGTQQGTEHDHLRVDGPLQAGGRIRVRFQDGFAPTAGDTFTLIRANSVTGSFARVDVEGLEPGFQFETRFENGAFKLIALNDGVALPEEETTAQGVLANDTDADGDVLRAILVDKPDSGGLQLFGNGAFRYTAGNSFSGSDTFQYKVTDGFYESAPVTVTIANPAPVGIADAYSIDEDQTLFVDEATGVLSNDTDEPGAPLRAQLVHGPGHGSLDFFPNGSFAYRPAPNFSGEDTFSYVASDGLSRSERTTVTITVDPVNDAPIARADRVTTSFNTSLDVPTWFVLQNDTDPEGTELTVVEVSSSDETHGAVSLADGTITYVPDADFTGLANFVYVVRDADGATAEGRVTVDVRGPAPTGVEDAYSVNEDELLEVSADDGVLANDTPENGSLTARLVRGPRNGRLSLAQDGSFEYEPRDDFFGTDTFVYRAFAGTVGSEPVTVTLTVEPQSDPPVARPDSKSTARDRELVFAATDLLLNDFDPDGDEISVIAVEAINSTSGNVTFAQGQVTYSPAAGFTGIDRFMYTIEDEDGEQASAVVEVRVATPVQSLGRVQGTGWFDDFQRSISVNVSSTERGGVTGTFRFVDFENELLFVAKTFDTFEISRSGRVATITGTGRMNGQAGYSFTATFDDRGPQGTQDRVRMQITGPGGFRYDSLEHSSNFGRLSFGDVRVVPVGPILLPVRNATVMPAANDMVLAASFLQESTNPAKKKSGL